MLPPTIQPGYHRVFNHVGGAGVRPGLFAVCCAVSFSQSEMLQARFGGEVADTNSGYVSALV